MRSHPKVQIGSRSLFEQDMAPPLCKPDLQSAVSPTFGRQPLMTMCSPNSDALPSQSSQVANLGYGRLTTCPTRSTTRLAVLVLGASVFAGLLTTHADATDKIVYPSARRGDVVADYHGTKVPDPYRWLEQLDSPETKTWVRAEAQVTEAYLKQIPSRSGLEDRLTALQDFEKYGVPFEKGGRIFYTYNHGLQPQSVLRLVENTSSAPSVALDPNLLSTNGSLAVIGYVPSRDGKLLAYGVSKG